MPIRLSDIPETTTQPMRLSDIPEEPKKPTLKDYEEWLLQPSKKKGLEIPEKPQITEPEFVQRMGRKDAPFMQNADGTKSSHKMAWGSDDKGFYAFPTIINRNGQLVKLSPKEADAYAHKTGEIKRFKTKEEAESYAAGSWKRPKVIPGQIPGLPREAMFQVADQMTEMGTKARPGLTERATKGFINKLLVSPARTIATEGGLGKLSTGLNVLNQLEELKAAGDPETLEVERLRLLIKNNLEPVKGEKKEQKQQRLTRLRQARQDIAPLLKKRISGFLKTGKKQTAEQVQKAIPAFEVPPPETLPEKATEIGTGLAAFMAKLALTKKVLGVKPTSTFGDVVAWEVLNEAEGGTPGTGAAFRLTLGAMDKIPGVTTKAKIGKLGLKSGAFAGLAAAHGAGKEEIVISALIPVVFQGYATARGRISDAQMVKSWRSQLPFTRDIPLKSSLKFARAMRSVYEIRNPKNKPNAQEKMYAQWDKQYGKTVDTFLKQANDAFVKAGGKAPAPTAGIGGTVTEQPFTHPIRPETQPAVKPRGIVPTEVVRPIVKPAITPKPVPTVPQGPVTREGIFNTYKKNMPNATEQEIVEAMLEDGQRPTPELMEKYKELPAVREIKAEDLNRRIAAKSRRGILPGQKVPEVAPKPQRLEDIAKAEPKVAPEVEEYWGKGHLITAEGQLGPKIETKSIKGKPEIQGKRLITKLYEAAKEDKISNDDFSALQDKIRHIISAENLKTRAEGKLTNLQKREIETAPTFEEVSAEINSIIKPVKAVREAAKQPWEMTSREKESLVKDVLSVKGVIGSPGGDIWITDETDIDTLLNINPNMTVMIKDTDGHRQDFSLEQYAELVKNEAFSDRIREVYLFPASKPSARTIYNPSTERYIVDKKFMGKDVSEIRKQLPAGEVPVLEVEPMEGIVLKNNATVRRERVNDFQSAVANPVVRKELQSLGIKKVIIEAPHKFDLSEQANYNPKTKEIQVNADADNPTKSIMHELGHANYKTLSEQQKTQFKKSYKNIKNEVVAGYQKLDMPEEVFAEIYAHKGEKWADEALAKPPTKTEQVIEKMTKKDIFQSPEAQKIRQKAQTMADKTNKRIMLYYGRDKKFHLSAALNPPKGIREYKAVTPTIPELETEKQKALKTARKNIKEYLTDTEKKAAITKDEKNALREKGYTVPQILSMKPKEARRKLAEKTSKPKGPPIQASVGASRSPELDKVLQRAAKITNIVHVSQRNGKWIAGKNPPKYGDYYKLERGKSSFIKGQAVFEKESEAIEAARYIAKNTGDPVYVRWGKTGFEISKEKPKVDHATVRPRGPGLTKAEKEILSRQQAAESEIAQEEGKKVGYKMGIAELNQKIADLVNQMKTENAVVDKLQRDMFDLVRYGLPTSERGKVNVMALLKSVTPKNTKQTNLKKLARAAQMVSRYAEQSEQRRLRGEIKGELKKAKPKKDKGILKGKYTADIQKRLDEIQRYLDADRDLIRIQIAHNLAKYESGEIPYEDMIAENMRLSMAGIKGMSSQELQYVLDNIKSLKETGKAIREDQRIKDAERIENIRQDIVGVLTGGKGLKPGQTSVPHQQLEVRKTAVETVVNWQYGWDNYLDKVSKYDTKSRQYQSKLSKFGNIVHEAHNAEIAGIDKQIEKVYKKFVEIFDIKTSRQANHIFNRLKQKINIGTFKNADGVKIELNLSREQLMKKYQELHDLTLERTFRGGVTEDGKIWGMRWTDEIIDAVNQSLSPQEKKWADYQISFYREYYDSVNKVYREVYGVDLPFNLFYSPIGRDVEADVPEIVLFAKEAGNFAAVTNGSLKSRTANTLPLKFGNADAVLVNHIIQMEHFKAWAETMKDLRRVLMNKEVRTAIRQYHGSKILRQVDVLLNDMARGGVDKKQINRYVDKLRRNFTLSVLGVKPIIALKQIPSVLSYATEIPIGDYVFGISNFWKSPIKNIQYLRDNSPYFRSRWKRGFERDIRFAMKKGYSKTLTEKGNVRDWFMALIRAGDKTATMQGAWSVFQSAKKQGLSDKEALLMAEKATERTQPTYSLQSLSPLQRGGSWAKLFTMFQNQPNKYFRIVADNARNVRYGRQKVSKGLINILLAWVVLPSLFQFIADAFQFKKKNQLRAAALGPINHLLVAGQMVNTLWGYLYEDKYDIQISPVFSTTKDITNAVMKSVKIAKDGKNPFKDVQMEDLVKAVEFYGQAIGKLAGLPTPYAIQIEQTARRTLPEKEEKRYKEVKERMPGWRRTRLAEVAFSTYSLKAEDKYKPMIADEENFVENFKKLDDVYEMLDVYAMATAKERVMAEDELNKKLENRFYQLTNEKDVKPAEIKKMKDYMNRYGITVEEVRRMLFDRRIRQKVNRLQTPPSPTAGRPDLNMMLRLNRISERLEEKQ